ncbi:hypothetical protein Nepgr_002396 [Nepenthes gracilis]|uniref:Uncharacterized protein n=1 Tax=Nepenthes gracilis TaxID=150966 RepID=A0AAD3RWV3_NEPGR|nr:hypothetical protein Nepgr_002396 [Nepenthes gracilis]
MFPRRSCDSTVKIKNFLELDGKKAPTTLPRSRSSRAAGATISALRKVLEALKSLPASWPGSVSRKLLRRKPKNITEHENIIVNVKIKDILRWRSFRDLMDDEEENSQLLDCSSPPHWCTTVTMGSSSGCSTISSGSSFADSDFSTIPEDSACVDNSGRCKTWNSGGESVEVATGTNYHDVGLKGKVASEDKEQHSPVSVLDSPFREDEEPFLSFDESLANVERTKERLLQSIQWFESLAGVEPINLDECFSTQEDNNPVEEEQEEEQQNGAEARAWQLMQHVKTTGSKELYEANLDHLLFDFFMQELMANRNRRKDNKLLDSMENVAKAYLSVHGMTFVCEEQGVKEAFIEDMEKEARWSKFEEEQKELAMEMEIRLPREDQFQLSSLWPDEPPLMVSDYSCNGRAIPSSSSITVNFIPSLEGRRQLRAAFAAAGDTQLQTDPKTKPGDANARVR